MQDFVEDGAVDELLVGQIFASDGAAEQIPMILWSLDTYAQPPTIAETKKKTVVLDAGK